MLDQPKNSYQILESVPGFVYVQNPDYSIRYANSTFINLFGEPGNNKCYEIIHDRDTPCAYCPTFKVFKDKHAQKWLFEKDDKIYQLFDNLFIDDGEELVVEMGFDITGTREALDEKNIIDKQYKQLIDGVFAGIWKIDKDNRITFFNRQLADMLSYDTKEMLGKKIFDFMDKKHTKIAKNKLGEGKKGHTSSYENQFIDKYGNPIIVHVDSRPYFDPEGRYVGSVSFITDITERQNLFNKLEKEKSKFKSLMKNSPDFILEIDRKGKILYSNRAEKGLENKELIGKDITKYHHIDSRKTLSSAIDMAINDKKQVDVITRSSAGHLKKKWYKNRIIPLATNHNAKTLLFISTDITKDHRLSEEVNEDNKILKAAQRISSVGHWTYDIGSGRMSWSEELYNIFGLDKSKGFPNRPDGLKKFIHPDDHEKFYSAFENSKTKGLPGNMIITIIRGDDTRRTVNAKLELKKDKKDGPPRIIGTIQDITELKLAHQKIKESEERLRLIAENATDVIYKIIFKPEFRYEYVSPSVTKTIGYTPEEHYLDPDINDKIVHPEDKRRLDNFFSNRDFSKPFIARWKTKNGTYIWMEDIVNPIYDQNGELESIEGIARNITERKKIEDELKFLSFNDQLTKLYNRAYFDNEIKRLDTKRQLPISIIIGDVDNLKLINDAFGHSNGDKALIRISKILREACRKEDIISRWGGDEFAIILPRTTNKKAQDVLVRIIDRTKKTKQSKTPLSISLGLATKSKKSRKIRDVIIDAENNMYKNKIVQRKSITGSLITSFEKALFEQSHESKGHAKRIKELSLKMGKKLGLKGEEISKLSLLASLHDIGKITIPREIISKKGPLSRKESEKIKKHPIVGYNICKASPLLSYIAEGVLGHHEWWDGSGYPQGLQKNEIPLVSRIISIVDAYDVMLKGRPYSKPKSKALALKELQKQSGTQFDPDLVEIFYGIVS